MKKIPLLLLAAVSLPLLTKTALGQHDCGELNPHVKSTRQVKTGPDYTGPIALGPLSIKNKEGGIPFKKFASALGQMTVVPGDYACYRNASDDAQLVVELGIDDRRLLRGLTLSRIKLCLGTRVKQVAGFSRWKTEKGIGLGSAATDVLSKYGNPTSIWDSHTERAFTPYPREGDRSRMTSQECILAYVPTEGAADTSHAFFGIRSGLVVWITVSDNE